MALEKITKFVVSYCEIPEDLLEGHWIQEHSCDSYVECHIENEEEHDPVSKWLSENYPELKDEESFFIHMDY